MGILGFKLVSFHYYWTDFQNSKSIFILEVDSTPLSYIKITNFP
jgi:hypothetical protein